MNKHFSEFFAPRAMTLVRRLKQKLTQFEKSLGGKNNRPGESLPDLETLHDLRVAARRLKTNLAMLQKNDLLYPEFYLNYFQKRIGWVLKKSNKARDLTILLETLSKLPLGISHPLESARDNWSGRAREKLWLEVRGLGDLLAEGGYRWNIQQLEGLLRLPVRSQKDGSPEQIAYGLWEKEQKKLAKRLPRVSDHLDDDPWLHELRLEIKEFRYLIEFIKELLPPSVSRQLKQTRQFQTELGNIHDAYFLRFMPEKFGLPAHAGLADYWVEYLAAYKNKNLHALQEKIRQHF